MATWIDRSQTVNTFIKTAPITSTISSGNLGDADRLFIESDAGPTARRRSHHCQHQMEETSNAGILVLTLSTRAFE